VADNDITQETTGNMNEPGPAAATPSRREAPDTVTLVAGVLALMVSGYVLLGGFNYVHIQPLLAVGAVIVGIVMLIASLRSRRDR
jgi:hypothetical protein